MIQHTALTRRKTKNLYVVRKMNCQRKIQYYEIMSTDNHSQTLSGKISKNRNQNIGIKEAIIPAYSVTCMFLNVFFMSLNKVTLWKL